MVMMGSLKLQTYRGITPKRYHEKFLVYFVENGRQEVVGQRRVNNLLTAGHDIHVYEWREYELGLAPCGCQKTCASVHPVVTSNNHMCGVTKMLCNLTPRCSTYGRTKTTPKGVDTKYHFMFTMF